MAVEKTPTGADGPDNKPLGGFRLFRRGPGSGAEPPTHGSLAIAAPIPGTEAAPDPVTVLPFRSPAEPANVGIPIAEPSTENAVNAGGALTHLYPTHGVITEPRPETKEEEKKEEELTPAGKSRRRFLAGMAGVGAAAVVESSPLLRSLVNPLFEKGLEAIGLKEAPVPSTFDNRADRGLIGDNNILPLSSSEIQQRFPDQIVAEGDNITFLFPFQPPKDGKIQYARASGLPALSKPEDVPEKDRERQAQAIKDQEEIKRKGIKSQLDFVLPKDTVIVAPVGGHVTIPMGRQDQFGGRSDMTQWARLTYYDKGQNTTYVFQFVAPGETGVTDNLYPLIPLQDYKPGGESGTNWEKLPEIQQGQPMLKTTRKNQQIKLSIKAYRGENIGPQAEIVDKTLFYVTPDFLTTTDNTGREKLVVM